jgi:hypothetical protein
MWRSRCREALFVSLLCAHCPLLSTDCALPAAFCFPGSGSAVLEAQARPASKPESQPAAKAQPIPFSHKVHAQFVVDCLYCHAVEVSGREMTYPAEAQCMQCHATIKADSAPIRTLAEFYQQKKPMPWVRIYEVSDYVFFSHRVHFKRAKIGCQVCHGRVAERDTLSKEKPTSMQSCVDCHKLKQAPVNCRACHER